MGRTVPGSCPSGNARVGRIEKAGCHTWRYTDGDVLSSGSNWSLITYMSIDKFFA